MHCGHASSYSASWRYESPFACLQNQFFQIFNSHSSDYIFFSFVYFDFPLLWEHLNAFKGLPEKPLLFTWKIKVSVVVHRIIMITISYNNKMDWFTIGQKQQAAFADEVHCKLPSTNNQFLTLFWFAKGFIFVHINLKPQNISLLLVVKLFLFVCFFFSKELE